MPDNEAGAEFALTVETWLDSNNWIDCPSIPCFVSIVTVFCFLL